METTHSVPQVKMLLPLNLQYFNDGSAGGGDAAAAQPTLDAQPVHGGEAGGAGEQSQRVNPLLDGGIWESEPVSDPVVPDGGDFAEDPTFNQEPQVEYLDFGGRQVPVNDPILRELHGDWSELNRSFHLVNQRAQQAEMQAQQMYQMMQQFMQQQQQVQQQPQQPQLTPEQIQQQNQAFLDRLWEDPLNTINEHTQKVVQQALEQQRAEILGEVSPIIEERKFNQSVQALEARYGESINPYADTMAEILQANPHLEQLPNAMETLYLMAKGQMANQIVQQVPRSVDDILANPQWREQILQNQQVRDQIVRGYVQNVQQKQTQAPPTIGQAGAGLAQAPIVPPNKPKTIQEGGKAFREWMKTQQQ
ncbi:hypothetical protein [Brevibacillus migulae]|uniref:hypothetical protein n=1 Tax=Brevibacillus migulae TaxID=1644114 RepID=UPI00106EF569|nr:hypothetical protein [Brevibacillus migulae]